MRFFWWSYGIHRTWSTALCSSAQSYGRTVSVTTVSSTKPSKLLILSRDRGLVPCLGSLETESTVYCCGGLERHGEPHTGDRRTCMWAGIIRLQTHQKWYRYDEHSSRQRQPGCILLTKWEFNSEQNFAQLNLINNYTTILMIEWMMIPGNIFEEGKLSIITSSFFF